MGLRPQTLLQGVLYRGVWCGDGRNADMPLQIIEDRPWHGTIAALCGYSLGFSQRLGELTQEWRSLPTSTAPPCKLMQCLAHHHMTQHRMAQQSCHDGSEDRTCMECDACIGSTNLPHDDLGKSPQNSPWVESHQHLLMHCLIDDASACVKEPAPPILKDSGRDVKHVLLGRGYLQLCRTSACRSVHKEPQRYLPLPGRRLQQEIL